MEFSLYFSDNDWILRILQLHGSPSGRPRKPSISPRSFPKEMDGGPFYITGANFDPSGGDWNRPVRPDGRDCATRLLPRFGHLLKVGN